jgi:hypothetical protein
MPKLGQLRVAERKSSTLVGPILLGSHQGESLSMYQFSELVVCDWIVNSDDWVRETLSIEPYRLKRESVRFVIMSAWPCSLSGDGYEDAGWAVDAWRAGIKHAASGDQIEVALEVAAIGKGTSIARIGYSWTAYTQSQK